MCQLRHCYNNCRDPALEINSRPLLVDDRLLPGFILMSSAALVSGRAESRTLRQRGLLPSSGRRSSSALRRLGKGPRVIIRHGASP